MLEFIKNILKRILPPPVRAFNREVDRILAAVLSVKKDIQAELDAHHKEEAERWNQIRTVQETLFREMDKQLCALQEEFANSVTMQLHAVQMEMMECLSKQLYTSEAELRKQLHAAQVEATEGLTKQLHAVQVEATEGLTKQLHVVQAEIVNGLAQQMYSVMEQATTDLQNRNEKMVAHLEAQGRELSTLRKENKLSEQHVIQKIEREKQELFYEYYSRLEPEQYKKELVLWYRKRTGKMLNLEDPKTFNEKIQWMKLYDSTPLKTKLADKYLVRDWVSEKIGEEYLIPLLGVWDSFDEIDFEGLPNQFVLKANHGCGWNIVVKDKATFNKAEAKIKFDKWLRTNYAFVGLELHYMNIQPRIIAEAYLENDSGDLDDYKVFCFNGKAESIRYQCERSTGLKMAFYDTQWNKLPFVCSFPMNSSDVPKPKNLELLVSLSEKLASEFPHVRVDFYMLNDGSLKFGEMTFTSANGSARWDPPGQDQVYGELLQLPQESDIPDLGI